MEYPCFYHPTYHRDRLQALAWVTTRCMVGSSWGTCFISPHLRGQEVSLRCYHSGPMRLHYYTPSPLTKRRASWTSTPIRRSCMSVLTRHTLTTCIARGLSMPHSLGRIWHVSRCSYLLVLQQTRRFWTQCWQQMQQQRTQLGTTVVGWVRIFLSSPEKHHWIS